MAILTFSDVLEKVGLDPTRVKLIRHALSDKGFKKCYDKDMVLEYTSSRIRDSARTMTIGVYLSVTKVPMLNSGDATRCWVLFRIRLMPYPKVSHFRKLSKEKVRSISWNT